MPNVRAGAPLAHKLFLSRFTSYRQHWGMSINEEAGRDNCDWVHTGAIASVCSSLYGINPPIPVKAPRAGARDQGATHYSHSMVAGGLLETSQVTRDGTTGSNNQLTP